jgi:DNA-binding beta-propeller fold protein YncE
MWRAIMILAATLPSLPHSPDLYVSGFFAPAVFRYYGPRSAVSGPHPIPGRADAQYARGFSRRPWGLAFGPDGDLYVAGLFSGALTKVRGPFTDSPGASETIVDSGLFYDVAFGPDGNLYASGRGPVQRFDIVTKQLIGDFTHGHDLAEVRGIAFGPDGNLYASNYDDGKGEIVRFDGLTGAFLDVYVPDRRGGLRWPWKIAFGPTGELFVANSTPDANNILRFASPLKSASGFPIVTRGTASAVFISRPNFNPLYLAFGPDRNLYVSDGGSDGSSGNVLRFNGATGAFIDTFVVNVEGGPRGIAFSPGLR